MADDIEVKPGILKWVFTFVMVLGVVFYFTWGFAYNALFDLANYTASAILFFTGLFGMFLYRELEKEEAAAS
jgi:uncharacterized membrane protein